MQPVPYQRPHGLVQTVFWIYPTWQVGAAADHDRPVAWLLCLVAGVLWQLVYRRDLADRLTIICVFVVTSVALGILVNLGFGGDVTFDVGPGGAAAALACLAGLVVTEQHLRLQDVRRWRRARRADVPEETVAARP